MQNETYFSTDPSNLARTADNGGRRVIVVDSGTAYIDRIMRSCPDRALFVTDPEIRSKGTEPAPEQQDELLVSMNNPAEVLTEIKRHLLLYQLVPSGLVCFDDESMHLTSILAQSFGLPYPSPEAVLRCRCKLRSKQLWHASGLDCPAALQVDSADDAVAFHERVGKIVLKPLTGAGSELLFVCNTVSECRSAFENMLQGISRMSAYRMYSPYTLDGLSLNPGVSFIAEQFRYGTEYSCDIMLDGNLLEIIRINRKYQLPDSSGGIVMAYQILRQMPVEEGYLRRTLQMAANTLGIDHGICMVDFLIEQGSILLLELAPRPGGDCLPSLLRAACDLDIFDLTLAVAEGAPIELPKADIFRELVGLWLIAPLPGGVITELDTGLIEADKRVIEVKLGKQKGYRVLHPPEDYFSRILGHILFEPDSETEVKQQCIELLDRLVISYQQEESE